MMVILSSNVLIENTKIIGSKDKGVSIGEASNAVIINSEANNQIGFEVKDGSKLK